MVRIRFPPALSLQTLGSAGSNGQRVKRPARVTQIVAAEAENAVQGVRVDFGSGVVSASRSIAAS